MDKSKGSPAPGGTGALASRAVSGQKPALVPAVVALDRHPPPFTQSALPPRARRGRSAYRERQPRRRVYHAEANAENLQEGGPVTDLDREVGQARRARARGARARGAGRARARARRARAAAGGGAASARARARARAARRAASAGRGARARARAAILFFMVKALWKGDPYAGWIHDSADCGKGRAEARTFPPCHESETRNHEAGSAQPEAPGHPPAPSTGSLPPAGPPRSHHHGPARGGVPPARRGIPAGLSLSALGRKPGPSPLPSTSESGGAGTAILSTP